MNRDRVAPELRAPLRWLPGLPVDSALGRWLLNGFLALVPTPKVEGVRIEAIAGGDARLRLYVPEVRRSRGALLWIHGGGYVIGRASMDDRFCAETARDLGIVVASAEYRLAPRHPFPAPLDDCHAAWRWLRESAASLDVDPSRLAIGGQSGGGGLAAALVQRVHDEGIGAAAQWLFCPMLDDRTAARRDLDPVGHFVWDNRRNRFGWRAYLGVEPGAAALPAYASPARRSDLTGLPPAWSYASDIELFYDEDAAYAERLRGAGVPVVFETVAGAPHGFEAWASGSALAQRLLGSVRAWLGGALA